MEDFSISLDRLRKGGQGPFVGQTFILLIAVKRRSLPLGSH
jgi:hypothetical protein